MIKQLLRIPGCNLRVTFQLFVISIGGQSESWYKTFYDRDAAIKFMRGYKATYGMGSYCRTILIDEVGKAVSWVGELKPSSPTLASLVFGGRFSSVSSPSDVRTG